MNSNKTAALGIVNCRLSSESNALCSVSVSDGRITRIDRANVPLPGAASVIDAQGRLLSPGLIDVHIQGAGGADILDGTEDAFRSISMACARYGVTSFLATTVYRPRGDNRHCEAAAGACGKDLGGARMIGIHLEGPFISTKKQGMIQSDGVGVADRATFEAIFSCVKNTLTIMTIAPELPGSLELIKEFRKRKVVCALAHSAADYDQAKAGIDAGISQATHLFNAMASIHHRAPGPVPAILEAKQVMAQVIPDCVHVHPSILRMIWPVLGPDRFISITDGVRALGLPDGTYEYNGLSFESRDGAARYHDGTLIGTAVGLSVLVKRLAAAVGCTTDEALLTATRTAARSIGIDATKGEIAVGKDADLVIFENDLTVWKTIVRGKVVYSLV
jgi:N-acetylglucosamine-6-phosphate deacetylase